MCGGSSPLLLSTESWCWWSSACSSRGARECEARSRTCSSSLHRENPISAPTITPGGRGSATSESALQPQHERVVEQGRTGGAAGYCPRSARTDRLLPTASHVVPSALAAKPALGPRAGGGSVEPGTSNVLGVAPSAWGSPVVLFAQDGGCATPRGWR